MNDTQTIEQPPTDQAQASLYKPGSPEDEIRWTRKALEMGQDMAWERERDAVDELVNAALILNRNTRGETVRIELQRIGVLLGKAMRACLDSEAESRKLKQWEAWPVVPYRDPFAPAKPPASDEWT